MQNNNTTNRNVMTDFLNLVNEMAPYLLLGFLIAGLMHAFVPGRIYSRYLSAGNLRSVLLAALFGIPLPLCSCGVLPTAMSLRREGASKGATVSFLIATPQTGVDSIIATFSLLGLPFAIIRPLAALVTSVFGGVLINRFDRNSDDNAADTPAAVHEHTGHCCAEGTCDATQTPEPPQGFGAKLLLALRYGFVDMMQDIGKWLIIGLIVAGLITAFVPASFFADYVNTPLLSIVLVLLLAVPMYLCATGSIPIAAALMLKGLSPGAALVLLMAGPACNVASILVINKVLGRRTLVFYLISIVGGAVAFALGIDYLLPHEWFIPTFAGEMHDCCTPATPLYQWLSTGLLLLLLFNAFVIEPLRKRRKHRIAPALHAHDTKVQTFTVKGMSCHHCQHNVERAIRSVEGVEDVEVNLERGEARVKGRADAQAICTAVSQLGYEISIS